MFIYKQDVASLLILGPCIDFTEPDSDNPNGAAPTHKEKNLRVVLEYPGSIEPEKYALVDASIDFHLI